MTKKQILSVNEVLAKTFGEKAFGRDILMVQHPWTNDVFVFGNLDEPTLGRAQAYVVDEIGTVDDLGEICVTFNQCNASFVSFKDDFDISISIDTGTSTNPHYSTMDGIPGPVMEVLKEGLPGIKRSALNARKVAVA